MARMKQGSQSTRLSLRGMRADALHRLLLSPRGRVALTLADIEALPDLAAWGTNRLSVAIGDLVHDGRCEENAYGRIHVRPLDETPA